MAKWMERLDYVRKGGKKGLLVESSLNHSIHEFYGLMDLEPPHTLLNALGRALDGEKKERMSNG